MIKRLLSFFPILLIMLSLQGCFGLIIGGAAIGTYAVMNHKGIGTYYTDSNIKYDLEQRIQHQPNLQQNTHIIVAVYHQVVLFSGEVSSSAQKSQVGKLTQWVPGIIRVYNELTITPTISTLTRASDEVITSRVKSDMVLTRGLESRHIKIVTVNGVVFLMGNINVEQAGLAVNVTKHVSGVQKVMTLFQLIRTKS